jgi:hypothetical protein
MSMRKKGNSIMSIKEAFKGVRLIPVKVNSFNAAGQRIRVTNCFRIIKKW